MGRIYMNQPKNRKDDEKLRARVEPRDNAMEEWRR